VADRTPCSDPSTWTVDESHNPVGTPSPFPELASGCASISWDRHAILQPETSLRLTVIDTNAQYGPDGIAGTGDEQAVDSDGDGFVELRIPVNSDVDLAGELFALTQIAFASPVYEGIVKTSATKGMTSSGDGVIFIQETGDGDTPVALMARYTDEDINVPGAGLPSVPCADNPLVATALTQFVGTDVLLVSARVSDEGPNADGDGIADPHETIRLDISVVNSTLDTLRGKPDLEDITITLVARSQDVGPDRPIACILDGTSHFGRLESGIARSNEPADPFRIVIGDVQRSTVSQILRAELALGIEGRFTDTSGVERRVTSFASPQRFALNLDLDTDPGFPVNPLVGDAACVGGLNAGRVCSDPADCPGIKGDGSPATCDPLPARFQAGGGSLIAGQTGYFEGFEGAINMAGREAGFTIGPWPDPIEGTSFVHSPALNAAGGYLDGGLVGNSLDVHPGPLTPGAAPGTDPDHPQGSSAVDGSRCPYTEPRGPTKVYPPDVLEWMEGHCRPWDGSDWHVNDSKAFSGGRSLHGGVAGREDLGFDETLDSYHCNQLSAAFSGVFHVGVGGNAILSIHHIVQMADDRIFYMPLTQAAERGYVEYAEVDPISGDPVSPWFKLDAFQNNYGNTPVQPNFFWMCFFEGYDDFYDATAALGDTPGFDPGATNNAGVMYNADGISSEDDYFDPNDPQRLLGPSSGCYPAPVFSAMGDYTSQDPADSGLAFTDGELGETGSGVWVNSLFSLDEAAGRSIRVRFVMAGMAYQRGNTWAGIFGSFLGNGTRGWLLDDVAVSGLVDAPVYLVPDTRTLTSNECPVDPDPGTPDVNEAACDIITARAGVDVLTPVSGAPVTLDASASTADQCVDGFLEYRWRIGGATIQEFSTDPILVETPLLTTVYTLDVRCSTDPECLGSDSINVVPADELEVSGTPGELGEVWPAAPPTSFTGPEPIVEPVTTRWHEPSVGGTQTISVLAVDLAHNGSTLRSSGGQGASLASMAAALREDVCLLGTATPLGAGAVEFMEETLELERGEVVGYLAVSTSASGIVGTLGRGEQIGSPTAFGRGRRTPASLPGCAP
jgi:hypothetical protein